MHFPGWGMQPEDIKSRHQKMLSEPKQEPWTKEGEGTMGGGGEGKSKGRGGGGEETGVRGRWMKKGEEQERRGEEVRRRR